MTEQMNKNTNAPNGAKADSTGSGAQGVGGAIRFGQFFLSTRPNGMIGCLEFLILSLLGWAAVSVASAVLLIIWGGGVLAAVAPMAASESYSVAGTVFASAFSLICGLCALIIAVAACLYHARLLQLRLIDLGLNADFSVPGICSQFRLCFLAVILASVFSPLGLILFIFCCVAQGRTYRDNRDLFAPIAPVPPAAELARQMHARTM